MRKIIKRRRVKRINTSRNYRNEKKMEKVFNKQLIEYLIESEKTGAKFGSKEQLERLKKLKLKQREAFLKSLTEEVANTTNGEVIKPADVLYGKQTLAITLK